MKKNYLLTLLTALFCCFPIVTTSGNPDSRVTKEELDLKGNLGTDKQRSLIKPIQAFISEQSIEVVFNAGLGTIKVSVYDETGNAVYQQSEITYDGQVVFIDISSFKSGEYTIEFVNSQSQYMYGNFVIE